MPIIVHFPRLHRPTQHFPAAHSWRPPRWAPCARRLRSRSDPGVGIRCHRCRPSSFHSHPLRTWGQLPGVKNMAHFGSKNMASNGDSWLFYACECVFYDFYGYNCGISSAGSWDMGPLPPCLEKTHLWVLVELHPQGWTGDSCFEPSTIPYPFRLNISPKPWQKVGDWHIWTKGGKYYYRWYKIRHTKNGWLAWCYVPTLSRRRTFCHVFSFMKRFIMASLRFMNSWDLPKRCGFCNFDIFCLVTSRHHPGGGMIFNQFRRFLFACDLRTFQSANVGSTFSPYTYVYIYIHLEKKSVWYPPKSGLYRF